MFGNLVLDLVFAPWAMNALFAASRLKVFTILAEEAMSAEELAARTGGDLRLLGALLDACVGMGLLRFSDGLYANSHLGDTHLVEGRPLYMGDFIEIQATESGAWAQLYDRITGASGSTPTQSVDEADPGKFTLAMNNLAMLGEADTLAGAVDLSKCRTMVDAGCGSGMYSVALCRRYPQLRATLLDTAEVLKTTAKFIEANDLGNRITTRPADILQDAYGEDLDLVLLSDVLYRGPSDNTAVLRLAHDALTPGGILLVRGYYSDPEGSQPLFGSLFALGRMLDDPNREPISLAAVRSWLDDAGFKDVKTFALTDRSSCLTARK